MQFAETEGDLVRTRREVYNFARLDLVSRPYAADEQVKLDAMVGKCDAGAKRLNAYCDSDEGDESVVTEANNLKKPTRGAKRPTFLTDRVETWQPDAMAQAGAFCLDDSTGHVAIEFGLVKREDRASLQDGRGRMARMATHRLTQPPKPLHGEKLCLW